MPRFSSKVRFAHRGERRVGYVTPEFYNAAGSGSVNDYPALNGCVQALLDADGGGDIILRPGGRYRLDAPLSLPGTVNIRAKKGAGSAETALIRNHTFFLLRVDNTNSGDNETSTLIEGVTLTDAIASNGGALIEAYDGSVDLVRCALLGASFSDPSYPLLYADGGLGATVRLERCYMAPVNGQSAVLALTGTTAIGGASVVKVPATYTGDIVKINSTDANSPANIVLHGGTDFDALLHTSGAVVFVTAGGQNWAISANGCLFRGGSATSTGFVWTNTGLRRLNVGANTWNVTSRYLPAGGVSPLALDSDLALKPYLVFDAPGTTNTLPVGVRSYQVRFQSTAPTLTMPQALFAGQEMKVSVTNASGGNWAGVTVIGLIFGASGAINSNFGRSFTAHVVDRNLDGNLEWVVSGSWSDAWVA